MRPKMRLPQGLPRIRTTNALAELLRTWKAAELEAAEIEEAARLKLSIDEGKYEEREKDIPRLIREVLERESGPFTRLEKRCFFEDDAWLVRVGCGECEHLHDNGQEVFSLSRSNDLAPAVVEDESVSMHLVRIHVPWIFVRAVSMPMVRNHC